ncbi:hypothetical protein ATKI12_5775 [Kitasatospora sp. Ki12]
MKLEGPDIVAIYADEMWAAFSGTSVDHSELEQARAGFMENVQEAMAQM